MKTYSELSSLKTFRERFLYLKLGGKVGAETFGRNRYLNQALYRSYEWKQVCNAVIIRDNGCDLGIYGYEIHTRPLIHHINPITEDDILQRRPCVFDLENLVCTTLKTHNAIHYGDESILYDRLVIRKAGDTCPWRI